MIRPLIFTIAFVGTVASAKEGKCKFIEATKNWGKDSRPEEITSIKATEKHLIYSFKSGDKTIRCEVPSKNGAAGALDTKFVGWHKYLYGARELDECKDGYVDLAAFNKRKKWGMALIATYDGSAAAIYSCE